MFIGNVFQIFGASPLLLSFLQGEYGIWRWLALLSIPLCYLKNTARLETEHVAVKKKTSHTKQSLHSIKLQTGSKQCPGIVRLQVKTSSGFVIDDLTQQGYPQTGRSAFDIGNLLCLHIPASLQSTLHLL